MMDFFTIIPDQSIGSKNRQIGKFMKLKSLVSSMLSINSSLLNLMNKPMREIQKIKQWEVPEQEESVYLSEDKWFT